MGRARRHPYRWATIRIFYITCDGEECIEEMETRRVRVEWI